MDSLTYLTLVVSYRCSARCAHCCLSAGPDRAATWMTPEQARGYIEPLVRDNPIDFMSLIGGEALLEVDRTVAIGHIARQCGIAKVQIDTNASWCVDDDTTARVLERVYKAGLEIGAVSVDAFHQRYVPRDRVLRLLRVAASLGHPRRGQVYYLESPDAANPYDRATSQLVEWLGGLGHETYSGTAVLHGRGAGLAAVHAGPRTVPTDICAGVPAFRNDDFRRPGGIEIDVHGWVMVEHGICIGNAAELPVQQILGEYQAQSHPIISVLLAQGPIGLTRLPMAAGFRLRPEGYVDKCHLCHEVRCHLQPHFPKILAPAECYLPDCRQPHAGLQAPGH
ncbi:MAG: radical SAM protein [Candidatus Latescibacterota bacterium]|jgi:hypothetical protein